jgi:hypothetical protein
MAICGAYREKPDECDLSWKIRTFQHGLMDKIDKKGLPKEHDEMLDLALKYMNNTEAENMLDGTKVRMGHIWIAVFIIVSINIICLLGVRRHMKRQVDARLNTEVSEAVNQYFSLAA